MHFAFTSEQLAARDSVRALLERECTPVRVRSAWSDADGRVPGLSERLGELGVFGVLSPEEEGGLGLSEVDLVLLLEECGRFAVPGTVAETAAIAVPLLRDLATGSRRRWLRAIAAGEANVAVGFGEARLVAGAGSADVLLLEHGGEIHAVEADAVELEPQPSVDGARRLFRVRWVPSFATRLAQADVAQRALADSRDRGAIATAAELIGLARRMLAMTVDYVKTRHQFGRPIGSFQAIKHHLADALVAIETAAPSVYRSAYSQAHLAPDRSLHASMAKALAADAAALAARKALQCHGAIGYAFEGDLHMWMKRAWVRGADWGSAASHRARVAMAIFADGGT
jgi:alkylation response protein AidB-like acyl-CoA dehydrogenase